MSRQVNAATATWMTAKTASSFPLGFRLAISPVSHDYGWESSEVQQAYLSVPTSNMPERLPALLTDPGGVGERLRSSGHDGTAESRQ
jgi:hypothetical protein